MNPACGDGGGGTSIQVAFLTFLSLADLCDGVDVRRFIPRTRLTTSFLARG